MSKNYTTVRHRQHCKYKNVPVRETAAGKVQIFLAKKLGIGVSIKLVHQRDSPKRRIIERNYK
jgi:hypothetical protein